MIDVFSVYRIGRAARRVQHSMIPQHLRSNKESSMEEK
jgi:hypothetical protein